MIKLKAVLIITILLSSAAWAHPRTSRDHRAGLGEEAGRRGPVNFSYIEEQRAEVHIKDKGTQVVWRVDADALAQRTAWHDVGPPPGEWRGRSDLISTDDIAWVALAYLKQGEHGDGRSREEAAHALRTLLALQRRDGSFVAYQTGDAPGESPGLYNASDWMATARAVQAMGAGVRAFEARDRTLAQALQQALERSLQRVQGTWGRAEHSPGRHYVVDSMRLPAWLPYNRADGAAAFVLGLSDWYSTRHVQTPLPVLRAFADAIVETQRGNPTEYPWEAFLPEPDKPSLWYGDANLAVAALVRAHDVLSKPTYLTTAVLEADVFYPRLLTTYDMAWQMAPRPELMPRVPGTPASLALNACALFHASGKDRYALQAALFASAMAHVRKGRQPWYDAGSGRCAEVFTSAGPSKAASPGASARAICALLEVENTPAAHELDAESQAQGPSPIVLPAVEGRPVTQPIVVQDLDLPGGVKRMACVAHDFTFWLKFDVQHAESYRIDMIYVKDKTSGAVVNVRLDGDEILTLPLGSLTDAELLAARQCAVGPVRLDPGLHTLGVRGNGLLLSSGSLLDSFVVQPVVGWRIWRLPDGHRLGLFSSCGERAETVILPSSVDLPQRLRRTTLWRAGPEPGPVPQSQTMDASRLSDGTWRVTMPPWSSGSVEW